MLRGVGHAALHDPGEVNLCRLLQSSVIYDHRLLDRTIKRKEARKTSKRWHKVGGSFDEKVELALSPLIILIVGCTRSADNLR